jgi:hypothetical protein
MWQTARINVDSTTNIVTCAVSLFCRRCLHSNPTVRSDWHLSYDKGNWVFVPSKYILEQILKYKESRFSEVCSHPQTNP